MKVDENYKLMGTDALTFLKFLLMFHEMIHAGMPDLTDLENKYEMDIEAHGEIRVASASFGLNTLPMFGDMMHDEGRNMGIEQYHDNLCRVVTAMIKDMRKELDDDVWKNYVSAVLKEVPQK
jgi:hypothetical protein